MTTINGPRALTLLQRAVDEYGPDFIYQPPTKTIPLPDGSERDVKGCWYEVNGAPSCGVARALSYEGVPVSVLRDMDSATEDTSIGMVADILEANDVHLTEDAIDVFTRFQSWQDLDSAWGESLAYAEGALQ